MSDVTVEIQSLCLLVLAGFTVAQVFINRNHRESIKLLAERLDKAMGVIDQYIVDIRKAFQDAAEKSDGD